MHPSLNYVRYGFLLGAAWGLAACGGGGGGGSPAAAPTPPVATPTGVPVALVGAPAAVSAYSTVTLDGTLSREKTAAVTLSSYAWSQTAGPAVTLTGASTAQASFSAPQVTASTVFTFVLTVTDSTGASATATANVKVAPTLTSKTAVRIVSVKLLNAVTGDFHVDAVPTDGPPLAGSSMVMQVTLTGYVQSPIFTLIDASGASLGTAMLALSGLSSVQPLDFAGTITVPKVPFTVSASGTTADGQTFNVPSTSLFAPMNLTVGFSPARLLLKKAATATTQLQIFNGGTAGSYTVHLTDPQTLLASSADQTVQVAQGQTVSVPFTVTMPSTFTNTFAPKVTATVTLTTDVTQHGTATLTALLNGAP
jgi:hypothetical protein